MWIAHVNVIKRVGLPNSATKHIALRAKDKRYRLLPWKLCDRNVVLSGSSASGVPSKLSGFLSPSLSSSFSSPGKSCLGCPQCVLRKFVELQAIVNNSTYHVYKKRLT